MRSSYRDHYRRMVPLLVNMLDVRSSNSMHQPVVRALYLVKRYAGTPGGYYPVDEEKRKEYYEALGQPNEAKAFVGALQQQMIIALSSFDRALPKLAPKVRILEKNCGWIHVSPLEAQEEPQYLRKLKA